MENGSSTEKDQPERTDGRDETEQERLDRNLNELLQELRVVIPGVQVLFAFLLTVPFQQNFTKINNFQRDVYFATLLCTAISAILLMSPTAYHRLTFRYQQKRKLVFYSNHFAIIGLTFLAAAMTGALLLVTDVLFSTTTSAVVTGLAVTLFLVLWYALPLRRRLSLKAEGREPLAENESS
jgi:predicted membrane channel-forming protein YqfA (hemolysin III family)